jgi:hypothetical protein
MRTVVIVCLVLLLAAACGAETPVGDTAVTPLSERDMTVSALTTAIAASAQPPFDPTALRENLATAVALWNDQAIANYQVTINHRQPTWDTQYITITVADGVVVDTSQTCFPAQNCILRDVEPQTLTIEALFETADFVLGLNDPETEMTFNKTYGYPNAVIYEDASWVVNEFKPLEDE